MTRQVKKSELYTVRNHLNQFMGDWYAYNSEQAIARFLSTVNSHCNAFRKSGTRIKTENGFSAKVERL